MKKIRLTKNAEYDYERLEEFLYNQTGGSIRILERFQKEFLNAMQEISEYPESNVLVEELEGIRKKVKWHYLYFYVDLDESIEIIRIFSKNEDWISELIE